MLSHFAGPAAIAPANAPAAVSHGPRPRQISTCDPTTTSSSSTPLATPHYPSATTTATTTATAGIAANHRSGRVRMRRLLRGQLVTIRLELRPRALLRGVHAKRDRCDRTLPHLPTARNGGVEEYPCLTCGSRGARRREWWA